jgi:galacturonokinase
MRKAPDDRERMETLRRNVAARHGVPRDHVRMVRSPYRVCPLGAHIDHQLGPVTAMALDQSVLLAYVPAESDRVQLRSLDFPGTVAFTLTDIPGKQAGDWGNFPRGAAQALRKRYPLRRGIAGTLSGSLHGGGVSSSAAVGVALLLAFEDANGLRVSREENIALDQALENGYLGLRNGILDQAAILLARRGYLTRIDCATTGHRQIPAPPAMPPFRILLAYSGLRQALVGTDYNRRVEECTQAAQTLLAAAGRGDAPAVLGNVRAEEYAAQRHLLRDAPARRAAHFFGEVERVEQGVAAWQAGDLARFCALVTASGASSIHNYECGSPPLINLYHLLVASDGVYGARFSGAGFRGCCVALVEPRHAEEVAARVRTAYAQRHPELAAGASVVLCDAADGAALVDPSAEGPPS